MAENGEPIQIISSTEDHKFILNDEALQRILLHPFAQNHKLALVSIAGDFRKGKSFLLDFFLRYLRAEDKENWLGDENEPLIGFAWRGGMNRNTTGLWMWSEPILLKSKSGEEIAVLLMDTQGTFDMQSTVFENAFIFALTLLVSSITVYNIMHNLQEDNLQHLSFFADYGVLAVDKYSTTPFQQLTFLIRDWQFEYEAAYGFDGGNQVLKNCLEMKENQHKDLKLVRSRLRECFEYVNCFLMPHPGLKVTNRKDFVGQLKEIETEFKRELKTLVPQLFESENELFVKRINGECVNGAELLEYFRNYNKIFSSGELPTPHGIIQATAEVNNLKTKNKSKDFYEAEMNKHFGPDRPYINPERLAVTHESIFDEAMNKFDKTRKIGGEEFSKTYREDLETEILVRYDFYKNLNEKKKIFGSSQTPFAFIMTMIFSYVIGGILGNLGIAPLSFLLVLSFWVSFVILFIWLFTTYSGSYPEIGEKIDRVADFIVKKGFWPVYSRGVQMAFQSAVGRPKND